MQQNYINPETSPLPDIASVKRSLEFNNYLFNQQQLQRKSDLIKRQKMQEIHRSVLEQEKTLIDIENQKIYQMHKKHQLQQNLRKAYDNQIHSRHRFKTQEKSFDRMYGEKQKEMLENHERSRINDMSKMYNIGSAQKQRTNYFPNRKLLTQPCSDSLDNLKFESLPELNNRQQMDASGLEREASRYQQQTQSLKPSKQSFSSIDQPSLQNSQVKKHSAVNLEYAQYLKREIQRKHRTKDQQRRKQLQKDKTWIDNQNRAYFQKMEEMNYFNHKKKHDYASGLEKQLSWKKQYQNRL